VIPKIDKLAVPPQAAKPASKTRLSATPFHALLKATRARPPEVHAQLAHAAPLRSTVERPRDRAKPEDPRIDDEHAETEQLPARERREPFDPDVAPLVDPLARSLAPPSSPIAKATIVPAEHPAAVTTHTLAPELLDQAAFWGDGSRGVARLRFGSRAKGGLAGATVTLEHDGEAVSLRIEGDVELAETLRERLARKGVPLAD
jgi:hypothetical protein